MAKPGWLRILGVLACATGLLVAAVGANADLEICNKTSYVLETALAVEERGAAATRGWFRSAPGECKTVLQGRVEANKLFLHARALPIYGGSPLAQVGDADFCIAEGHFVIAGASKCPARSGQRLVRFTAVKPSEGENGLTANLAETANYSLTQARLAGIQRLLVLGGYDANPIDGVEGKKTELALAQFLRDRGLPQDASKEANFFAILGEAVKSADGIGFSWCNETQHIIMTALGIPGKNAVVTRGWYRLDPGKCLKPEIDGRPDKVYSFAEAIDADGQALRRADKTIIWGGSTPLCTRNVRFEIDDQTDCLGKGLNATGFVTVELAGKSGTTIRFREP